MPKVVRPLTDIEIRQTPPGEKQQRLTDGDGLYMMVKPGGSKLWYVGWTFDGKKENLPLGRYPIVSLQQARIRKNEIKAILAAGINPAAHKNQQPSTVHTFATVSADWFDRKLASTSERHRRRARAYLDNDLLPHLGNKEMKAITAPQLLECIHRVETRRNFKGEPVTETANRIRSLMGQLWRYAISVGKAERDIAADLKGALIPHVPSSYSYITDSAVLGKLMVAIDAYWGTPAVCAALRAAPLVWVRPGELRAAKWNDIDFDKKEWRYLSSKTKVQHTVPLSIQVIAILERLRMVTGHGEYVFQGHKPERPISDGTLNNALKALGFDATVIQPHGFRHTAATMLAERGWASDMIERQLSHTLGGVKGIYQNAQYLAQRRKMMQAWADCVDELKVRISLKQAA